MEVEASAWLRRVSFDLAFIGESFETTEIFLCIDRTRRLHQGESPTKQRFMLPRAGPTYRNNNIVTNLVLSKEVQCPVAVCLISIPGIIVQRVRVTVGDAFVHLGEDSLRTNDSPARTTLG